MHTAPVRANYGCSWLWLSPTPLNVVPITDLAFIDSHTKITMVLKLSLIPFTDRFLSPRDTPPLSPHCHSHFLPVFQRSKMIHNRSAKITVCWRVVSCNSVSESELTKFYRLKLPLWPEQSTPTTPTPVSNPFPQPWSWVWIPIK